MAHIKITTDRLSTNSKVEIDGLDVAGSCKGVMFSAYLGEPAEVHLDLVLRGSTVEGEARIRIDPHTAAILKAAGWTPPGPKGLLSGDHPYPDAPRLDPEVPRLSGEALFRPLRKGVPPS